MSKPVAKDLDDKEPLREVIDALRADNGRLLRLLLARNGGRPEHKELTEVLTHNPNGDWLGTGDLTILDAHQNQVTQRQNNVQSSAAQTACVLTRNAAAYAAKHETAQMLEPQQPAPFVGADAQEPIPSFRETILLATGFVRRNVRLILVFTFVGVIFGLIYLTVAMPRFTAVADLYIEDPKLHILSQPETVTRDTNIDSQTVDSQVEILKSDAVAMKVIKDLHLTGDPRFMASSRSFMRDLIAPGLSPEQRALRTLTKNLTVSRVGISAVIKLSYVDSDPVKAAQIANAICRAYIQAQVDSKREAAEIASNWLEGRLQEIQNKAAAAEKEVQNFRDKNNLEAQAALSELQANAKAYRRLYDSFLQRYAEIVQQQSLRLAEARLVSPALPSSTKSPNVLIVLPASILAGLMLGIGIALRAELSDRTFRTPDQILEHLGLNCLAVLEAVPASSSSVFLKQRRSASKGSPWLSKIFVDPGSQVAESLRGVKLACDRMRDHSTVIGVTSILRKEGKTTVAANLAKIIARSGAKIIIIDADLHSRALSRILAPSATRGLFEATGDRSTLDELVQVDPETGMSFLPNVATQGPVETSEFLNSNIMRTFLDKIRGRYDYIILDLPSITSVVDVRASVDIVDTYILVVEWGRTSIKTVQRVLGSAQHVCNKVLGVVLNKVTLRLLQMEGYEEDELRSSTF